MWRLRILIPTIVLFGMSCFSQTAETASLLHKADQIVYDDPSQSIKVAQHILTLDEPAAIRADAALVLARAHLVKGNYGATLKWARLALRESTDAGTYDGIQNAKAILAEVYDFLYLSELSKKYAENSKDIPGITKGTPLQLKAQEFEAKQRADSARSYFLGNLEEIDRQKKGPYWKSKGLLAFGNHLLTQKDYGKATSVLNDAVASQQKIGNPQIEKAAYEKLSLAWMALGNRDAFMRYKALAADAEQKLENNITAATNLSFEYLADDKAEAIRLAESRDTNTMLLLAGLAAVLILVWSALRWQYRMRRNHLNDFINYLTVIKRRAVIPMAAKVSTRPSSIPKSTEEALLIKLEKFENGQKFIIEKSNCTQK